MKFNKVESRKGSEIVAEQLLASIQSGSLRPGDRLPAVTELAEQFGVGRSTIREALSALKATGWLRIRQGGGTFVSDPVPSDNPDPWQQHIHNADSLKELLQVRKMLETGCASLAAQQRTNEDLRQLQALLDRMAESTDNEVDSERADVAFHLGIARATGNSLLLGMMNSLSDRLHETMRDSRRLWFYGAKASAERLLAEHRSIVDAIAQKDAPLASRQMARHLETVESTLKRSNLFTPP